MVTKFGLYSGSLVMDSALGRGDSNVPVRAAQIRCQAEPVARTVHILSPNARALRPTRARASFL